MLINLGSSEFKLDDVSFIAKNPELVGGMARLAMQTVVDPSVVRTALDEQVYTNPALADSEPGRVVLSRVSDGFDLSSTED